MYIAYIPDMLPVFDESVECGAILLATIFKQLVISNSLALLMKYVDYINNRIFNTFFNVLLLRLSPPL